MENAEIGAILVEEKKKIAFLPILYPGLIFLFTAVVYGVNLSPALYYDDWDRFAYPFFRGGLPWFIPGFVRPLTYTPYRLQTEILGFNLPAILAVRVLLLFLSAWLFFLILEKLKVFPSPINLMVTGLFLFAPMDMTRMWMLMDPFAILCVEVYALCLLMYVEKRRIAWYLAGVISAFACLLYYEAPLGLMLAFPVVLFAWLRIKEKKFYWELGAVLVLGLAYLLFRALGPLLGMTDFHSSQSLTVLYLLRQVRNALVCLIQGWYVPFRDAPFIRAAALAATALAGLVFGWHLVKYGLEKNLRALIVKSAVLFGAGVFLWLAGYFPWMAYGVPAYMNWFSSRAHNFAIPGAVLSLAALAVFLGALLKVSPERKMLVSSMLMLPFLVIAISAQITIQYESKLLWNDYRAMWKGVFAAVPDFKDGSHIVLVINPAADKLRYGEREFYTAASFNTEITRAFDLFYNNQTLEGEFMFKDVEVEHTPSLHDNGLHNPPTYSGAIPYADVIFIAFDRATGQVRVVRDLQQEFGIADPSYDADGHIVNRPMARPSLRFIFDQ